MESEPVSYGAESADLDYCIVERIERPFCVVIFGASGDLTRRKLIPSIYNLFKNGLLPKHFYILGISRSDFTDIRYREHLAEWIRKTASDHSEEQWNDFSQRIFYRRLGYGVQEDYLLLKKTIIDLSKRLRTENNKIFHLATPPHLYKDIIKNLGEARLSMQDDGFSRIIVEKPFGSDLTSAGSLNSILLKYFSEEQIFRIDHYLGKETVQDILMFRFANSIFEPVWNRNFIDHVQITVAESIGVEHRAGFYDRAGVLRDMFQNHMLQLLSLIAMEPPSSLDSERVRDEKVKVFRNLKPFQESLIEERIILGQYSEGDVNGEHVPGYLDEEGVDPQSATPTSAALKVFVDNWRWNGVPFYLRSGKRLAKKSTEIAVQFKGVPHRMFHEFLTDISPNVITFKIQPEEAISLIFHTKVPGSRVCLREVKMDFRYKDFYAALFLEAYERVILDCLIGDHILFVRQDGSELTWTFLMPLLEKIEKTHDIPLYRYRAGTAGPEEADAFLRKDGRTWRPL